MNELLLSEAQLKFTALMSKAKELVPFATDERCEDAFDKLADFAGFVLQEKERRASKNFGEMNLEELLDLKGKGFFCYLPQRTFF